ncbi:MAG: hypothetical protein K1X64_07560 [Myxococcaceae bacterium]|nr:hypothetical protein [Myxococcaceae bacterium]
MGSRTKMSKVSARFLAVGFTLGFLLAVVPACSTAPAPTCSADCRGCCSSTGQCEGGFAPGACGINGNACVQCPFNQTCIGGLCGLITGSGGNSGTGGGTNAGGGNTPTGGGNTGGGETPMGGGPGGGINTGGGNTPTGGGVNTGGGEAPMGGGPGGGGGIAPCNSNNCAGCCANNVCWPGVASNNCGSGGKSCAICQVNQACIAGDCMQTGTGGSTGTGGGGGTGGGQGNGQIGSACTTDNDCSALGTGFKCRKVTDNGVTYPQGYCTSPCSTPHMPCGINAAGLCRGGPEDITVWGRGEKAGMCFARCPTPGQNTGCRSGYTCIDVTGPDDPGICWLNPLPDWYGGTPANKVGNACTNNSQCQNPPDPVLGFCQPQAASGSFQGGMCSAACYDDATGTLCGIGKLCARDVDSQTMQYTGAGFCVTRCTPSSGKSEANRPGYTCYTISDPNGFDTGMLFPSCDSQSGFCSQYPGTTCNSSTGYCCTGDGGCAEFLPFIGQ